jgi:hypothetical protein
MLRMKYRLIQAVRSTILALLLFVPAVTAYAGDKNSPRPAATRRVCLYQRDAYMEEDAKKAARDVTTTGLGARGAPSPFAPYPSGSLEPRQ